MKSFFGIFLVISSALGSSCNMKFCKACEHLERNKIMNNWCLQRSSCCEVYNDRFSGLTGATDEEDQLDPVKITTTADFFQEREDFSAFALVCITVSLLAFVIMIFMLERIVKASIGNSTNRCSPRSFSLY